MNKIFTCICLVFLLMGAISTPDYSAASQISMPSARQVAQNYLIRLGHAVENGSITIFDDGARPVIYQNTLVAYHFPLTPRGHILVAAHDQFSPVLLYSLTASFDPSLAQTPGYIEAWIIPEIYHCLRQLPMQSTVSRAVVGNGSHALQIQHAWQALIGAKPPSDETREAGRAAAVDNSAVGPLLTTQWAQGSPFWLDCPSVDNRCDHALVGCVGLAWAQLMRYWRWPLQGRGGHDYMWANQRLSADFDMRYQWNDMPDALTDDSVEYQKAAVSRLCYDAAIAAETDFGCTSSSASLWADDVLDTWFYYHPGMQRYQRSAFDADDWFALFQAELDAQPPRPVIFSIFQAYASGGHETVVDGYRLDLTPKLHINYGWNGSYDGYYDVAHHFSASTQWDGFYQVAVMGIEPDFAGGGCATYDTGRLHIPCVEIDGENYWVDLLLTADIDFVLDEHRWGIADDRAVCSTIEGLDVRVPCVAVVGEQYWVSLRLAGDRLMVTGIDHLYDNFE